MELATAGLGLSTVLSLVRLYGRVNDALKSPGVGSDEIKCIADLAEVIAKFNKKRSPNAPGISPCVNDTSRLCWNLCSGSQMQTSMPLS
jgi:hypothetical protein